MVTGMEMTWGGRDSVRGKRRGSEVDTAVFE